MGLLQTTPHTVDVLAGEAGSTVVRIDQECMNLLFNYYPLLKSEFEQTGDARRQESGLTTLAEPQELSLALRLRQAVREYLLPW